MLPFSYAEKVKELAHLGGVDDYKLMTCKIGDLWRFVVVDQCYKNMSAVGKPYTSEKALLLDAYDYAVMSWQATPTDLQWLRYKKTATTEEIGAVEHAIHMLNSLCQMNDAEVNTVINLENLLKKLTEK